MRLQALRTLASDTDGLAIVDTNDLERGMRRVVDDLSSYYLLGYYSSNGKLDGGYRSLKVKVTRSGVAVRARRGYRAATAADVERASNAARTAAVTGPPPALQTALASLASTRRDARLLAHVAWLAGTADGASPRLWADVEMAPAPARTSVASGTALRAAAISDDGAIVGQGRGAAAGGSRTFQVAIAPSSLPPGRYTLRVHLTAPGEPPLTEMMPFVIQEDAPAGARLLRAGASPALPFVPAGDARFRRTERLRVDVPAAGPVDRIDARLLDRSGGAMSVPLETSTREEDGVTWASAALVLAPLAPGDYAIEITTGRGSSSRPVVTAFRIVP
jgi:hypothetical protein